MAGMKLLSLGLSQKEIAYARRFLGREPNETEWSIIDAEWSEHSSYKSSKALLRLFPTSGKRVVLGPGYDAGVVDVGGGYVATLHIESHNHPSAVDPYGGSSTGIGGVLRDILSVGSRPIALVDMLRFGNIDQSAHSRWLFKNVVRGIADYGNCTGIPTVAGDVEFDASFERNCLVDVACIGLARKNGIILGEARHPGDIIVLAGGSTGRDGIRGATFASKNLDANAEYDRSSVQVPDPFMKKLILDAVLEAVETGLIRGMKDLGGGGLSTGLSEIASKGGTGVRVELGDVRLRESDMSTPEIMISESQERMLIILDPRRSEPVLSILEKYDVPYSTIGTVTDDGHLTITRDGRVVANLPARFVAEPPLVPRGARVPGYLAKLPRGGVPEPDVEQSIMALLSSPNIVSRRWVYQQYDHEVGLRTVLKPGYADAALLRLPNGSFLAVKGDGNSKQSFLDPYNGAAGCVAEACRNVVAVGATPIAMVDHLQFGDPSDPEVYWTFREAVRGMADYCKGVGLPVVGGKVSFYNEDLKAKRAIKPTPLALVVGLVRGQGILVTQGFQRQGDAVLIIGETRRELAGSEYYETVCHHIGGASPKVFPRADRKTYQLVRRLIRSKLVGAVHDCSKGGLGVSLAEMCFPSSLGVSVDLSAVPGERGRSDEVLFSESHGRFLVSSRDPVKVARLLKRAGVPFGVIGKVGGRSFKVSSDRTELSSLRVGHLRERWEAGLPELMD